MKKVLLLIVFLSLFSCDKLFKEKENTITEDSTKEYLVGGEKNEFGCVESAGYTWSVLKNDCIRVFEVGYRLNPINHNSDEPVISAFIVFSDDKDKVELFLPTNEPSIILNKKTDDLYENDKYKFNSKDFYLIIDNEKKYEAALENLKNIDDFQEDINEEHE